MDYIDRLDEKKLAIQTEKDKKNLLDVTKRGSENVVAEIARQHAKTRATTTKVEIANPKIEVTNLKDFPSTISTPDVQKVVEAVGELKEITRQAKIDLTPLITAVKELNSALLETSETHIVKPENVSVANLHDYSEQLERVIFTLENLEVSPVVNVESPKIPKQEVTVDLSGVVSKLDDLLKEIKRPLPEARAVDFSSIERAVSGVESAIKNQRFPVPNFILPYVDQEGKSSTATLNTDGSIPTNSPSQATQIKKDSGDTNILYIGKAPIGSATSSAVWQIARLDTTSGELVKTWVDGAAFTQVYDDRESLSYS